MFHKGRLVVGILAALVPATAAAQLAGSSGIAGVVRDTSGAVLPGVTVEASSPALIEQTRTVATDGQGRYSIVELRPGLYTVTFTLQGFSTIRREGVDLGPNFTATINAELRVGALEETITVRSESPVVDVLRVETRNVISKEALETLPTNKTLPAFVALTPGLVASATAQDVGGTKGEVFIQPAIHGGRSTEARTVLDGFETNSPDVAGSGRVFVPNPASTQAVSVELGDGPGDSPSSGVMINFVPRDGGNTFTGTFIANGSHDSLQGTNVSQELLDRGLNAGSIGGMEKIWDASMGVGGPIKRDRMWFFTSHRHWGSANRVPNSFYNALPGDSFLYQRDLGRPSLDDFTNRHHNIRITWQASQRNKFNFSWDNQYRCDCHRSVSQTLAPEATAARIYRPDIVTATWSFPLTSRFLFEAGSATSRLDYSPTPQDGAPADGISISDQANGLTYRAVPSSAGESTGLGQKYSLTQNSRFSVTYVTGSHAFKTGMTMRNMTRSYHNEGAGVNYRVNAGVPNQITLYAYPLKFHEVLKADVGLFAQDQWTIDRLTLNMAIRYDYLNAYVPAQVHPAGPFIQERNFAAVDCVPCWHDVSPRLSAAYNLFGDGRTALKVSVGKYMAQELLTLATANNPIAASNPTATRAWTDANRDWVPQEAELGPLSNTRFGTVVITTRYADEILRDNRQYNWKYSAGIQHEILPRTAVGLSYHRTTWHNHRVTQNLANTPADYDPFSFLAPSDPRLPGGGGYPVTDLWNLRQNRFGLVDNLVQLASNFGTQEEVYDGVDVSINTRLPGGTFFGGGLNTGRTRTNDCFVVNSPSLRFCENRPPFRTQVKLNGAYSLPWELKASAVFQSIPGIAYNANYAASNALVMPSLGRPLSGGAANVTVNLVEPGTHFEGRIYQVDLRFSRTFAVAGGRVQAMFDMYNALNAASILAVNNTFGGSWRSPSFILDARVLKFGVQYDF